MTTFTYRPANLAGSASLKEPNVLWLPPQQGAAFMEGNILTYTAIETATPPPYGGSGTGAGIAGPLAASITTGTSASAGAPAASYFCQVSYVFTNIATGISIPSAEFVINCPAGYLPTISVAAAGEPTGSAFFIAYMSLIPGYESIADDAATATGSTFTATFPLDSASKALALAATDAATMAGLALASSDATLYDGAGGSAFAGSNASRLGSTNTMQPTMPNNAMMIPMATFSAGQQMIEMSLLNTIGWSPTLIGSQVGIIQDSTTNFMPVADTAQGNKLFTIQNLAAGVNIGPTGGGTVGDFGVRVILSAIASTLLL